MSFGLFIVLFPTFNSLIFFDTKFLLSIFKKKFEGFSPILTFCHRDLISEPFNLCILISSNSLFLSFKFEIQFSLFSS